MKSSQVRVVLLALPVLVLLLPSCGGISRREGVTPAQAHMYAHFDRAAVVHDALVRGDLKRAKGSAEWIATHQEPEEFSGVSAELMAEMQTYAMNVSHSYHLYEANRAAAHMGQICGDCHRENNVRPRFLVGTAPPEGHGTDAEMILHVWAAERMWEGLVGPSDHAWNSGAEALRSGWLDPSQIVANAKDRTEVRELIQNVYDLGAQSEKTSDSSIRADLYGEFMNTCADCHRLTGALIR